MPKQNQLECIEDHIRHIRELNCKSSRSLAYALYLSIPSGDLLRYYIKYIDSSEIREKIAKQIFNRFTTGDEKVPASFKNLLLKEFEKASGVKRVLLGTMISNLSTHFSKLQLKRFFLQQISSTNRLDRNRAYRIAYSIFSQDIEPIIWKVWTQFQDRWAAELLIQKSTTKHLAEHFWEIWEIENLPMRSIHHAIKRVAKHDFQILEGLEPNNPISFLSACAAAHQQIGPEKACSLALRATTVSELGFAIWCIGKLGYSSALISLTSQLPEIESQLESDPYEEFEPA